MSNKQRVSSIGHASRRGIAVLIAVAFGLLAIPNVSGSIFAVGAGLVRLRYYIDGGVASTVSGQYPGTDCDIYKNSLTVSDAQRTFKDQWAEAFSRSFNITMFDVYSSYIKTQCGIIEDPDYINMINSQRNLQSEIDSVNNMVKH